MTTNERNLTFQEALKVLQTKQPGYRLYCDGTPGVVAWIAGGAMQSNLPIPVEAYFGNDWCIVQDDTVIR